jgi:iron complex outermembrane receptor protein
MFKTGVRSRTLGALSVSAIALLMTDASVLAQSRILEEVVVTAQKREQNLQDVGVAVTAFTGSQMEALGYTSSTDIVNMTPGMQLVSPNGGSSNFFTIRGVTQNDFTDHQESPVATYIDETYVSQMSAGNFQLFDMDRVEVLRGPQGTLFGRNATGGLVHFITRKPSQEFDAYAKAAYGSYNEVNLEGAVGGPVSDKVAVRLSGAYNRHDGVIENRIGRDLNNANDYAGRLQVLIEPTENFSALLSLRGAESDTRSGVYQHRASFVNAEGLGEYVPDNVDYYGTCAGCDAFGYKDTDGDPHAGDYDFIGSNEIKTWGATANLEWSKDNLTVTSITDYFELDKDYIEETDATPLALFQFYLQSDIHQFSQEVRALYEGDDYRVVGGVYYLEIDGDYANGLEIPIDGVTLDNPYTLNTRSWALFTQAEYDISSDVTIIGGFRWTEDKKTINYVSNLLSFPDNAQIMELARFDTSISDFARVSKGNWSAKVELDWRPVDGTLLYASWNRGIKGGGLNAPLDVSGLLDPVTGDLDAPRMAFGNEVINAYEVGVKTDLADGLVRLNSALFYYDYNDYQAFNFQGLTTFIVNTDAEIYGLDLEVIASPLDGLDVMFGASLIHARAFDVPLAAGPVDRDIALSPDVNLNGMVRYAWPAFDGTLAVQSDFKYLSGHYFSISNAPVTRQSNYLVANARVSYTTADDRWELAGYVKNLTDKKYDVIGFDVSSSGFTERFPGDPIWWGVSATFRY